MDSRAFEPGRQPADTSAQGRTRSSSNFARGRPANQDRCRRKFLRLFPRGFYDETYLAWERNYKWDAHRRWRTQLGEASLRAMIDRGQFEEVAMHAVRIESRTNLLFSFEKMALRDAVRTAAGAKLFATALYAFLHGPGAPAARFDNWCASIASLPRKQTRVLTWPLATVFGFLAQPSKHFFLKPNATCNAADKYGYEFRYSSRPSADGYAEALRFARAVRRDLADLRPRDLIDAQSFIWVVGSDEYA